MSDRIKLTRVVLLIMIACIIMAFIDAVISPDYFVKSICKLVLFLGVPLLYARWDRNVNFKRMFRINYKNLIVPILLGIGVYSFIIGAYYIIGPYFDFSNVTKELVSSYGVNKENFIMVAVYISFANSLLEEFFFRGFAFLVLKKVTSRRFAYLFSAITFSLYHIAIMSSWFNVFLFLLLLMGLFVAGLMFDRFNEKRETIYTSWFVHMFANFAINTIGFILFGII